MLPCTLCACLINSSVVLRTEYVMVQSKTSKLKFSPDNAQHALFCHGDVCEVQGKKDNDQCCQSLLKGTCSKCNSKLVRVGKKTRQTLIFDQEKSDENLLTKKPFCSFPYAAHIVCGLGRSTCNARHSRALQSCRLLQDSHRSHAVMCRG